MPSRSSNSAGATYLDREGRIENVRDAARRAAARLPSIRRVLLFGSLRTGDATVGSDADILVVMEPGEHANPRDRIPEVLRAMSPLPCPVDLFVVTPDELQRALDENAPLARTAVTTGLDLL